MDPHKTTLAIPQTIVLDKLISPIGIPFQFWMTINWMKQHRKEINMKEKTFDTLGVIKSKKSLKY